MKQKIRMGMVGGGAGAFIGEVHRRAARLCGDIELVDVKGDKVIVRFLGHCAGCMAARLTQDGLVEKALRAAIDPNISVEAV